MRTVAVPNINIKVWSRKNELPLWNYLRSLTQPKITRQRPFELTDIEYDIVKYQIASMERVEYNTSTGRNVMNVDDIEEFVGFREINI